MIRQFPDRRINETDFPLDILKLSNALNLNKNAIGAIITIELISKKLVTRVRGHIYRLDFIAIEKEIEDGEASLSEG